MIISGVYVIGKGNQTEICGRFEEAAEAGLIPVLNSNISLQAGQECPVYRG
jgi:hypothetical protein